MTVDTKPWPTYPSSTWEKTVESFKTKQKNYNLKLLFILFKGDGIKIKEELDVAFSTIGFVYLKNHGVDQYLVYTSIVYACRKIPMILKCYRLMKCTRHQGRFFSYPMM